MGKQRRRAKRKNPWGLSRYDYYYYRDNEIPKIDFSREYPFSKIQIDTLKAEFKNRCPDFELFVKFRTTWEEGMMCNGEADEDFQASYWIEWTSPERKQAVQQYPELLEAVFEPLEEIEGLLEYRRGNDEGLPWDDPEDCIEEIGALIQRLPPKLDILQKISELGGDDEIGQNIAVEEAELITADRQRRTPTACPFCNQAIPVADRLSHLRSNHFMISDLKRNAVAWLLNVPANEVGAIVPRNHQGKRRCYPLDSLEKFLQQKTS